MSPLGIASTVFKLISAVGGSSSSDSAATGASSTSAASRAQTDFRSSLAVRLASRQNSSLEALLGNLSGKSGSSALDGLFSDAASRYGLNGASSGFSVFDLPRMQGALSASGRNLSLFDPESAYAMMTNINNREVNYKAQFAELSEMRTALAGMQQAGQRLGSGLDSLDSGALKVQLQTFVDKYNEWVGRYGGTVKEGGLLAGTQAAEVSLYELRQSVENRFNGAMHGVKGLQELGITIDPATKRASFDDKRFDAVLANNRTGALSAIGEFSANFAKSAELLISTNNFVPNRLANLDRVIDYIGDNRNSLQAEFGLGDAPRPSALVSRALAAYERMAKTA